MMIFSLRRLVAGSKMVLYWAISEKHPGRLASVLNLDGGDARVGLSRI